MQIHIFCAGQRSGPHSLEEVQARIESGALLQTDLAWHEGLQDWIPLGQVPGLGFPKPTAPPPLPAAPSHSHLMTPPPRKGLLIAGGVGGILLGLLLFGGGLSLLVGQDHGGLGLLLLPISIGVGIVSFQFFLAMSRNPTGRCQVCSRFKPTIKGSMNRHIGAVILMFHRHITGHMCKDCISRIFWEYTPVTLAAGWWGMISFFVTPMVIANNVAYYIRSRLMK